jgi:dolichyl-phosphooligosaccharide-protein glycotransferase
MKAAIAALLIFGVAIVLRIALPWAGNLPAMEAGRAVIRDPDACYHLRRAAVIGEHGLGRALFDSYMNHPTGAHVIWPPLFDLVLAGAMRVFPVEQPGASVPVAFLPPILFAAAAVVLFRMARRVWPRSLGLPIVAALVPALLPSSLPYTSFALLDHHAAELLATAAAVAAIGGALASVKAGQSPWRAAWAPGLAIACALLTQLSLVVLLGLAPLCALAAPPAERRRALSAIAVGLGIAALLILPWGLFYAKGGAPFRHFQFGLFQPALAGAAALGTGILATLSRPRGRGVAIALVLLVPLAALGLVLGREIAGGLGYVGRTAPWLASIGESQPLFALGAAAGMREAMIQLSALALLLPVAWYRLLRDHAGDPRRRTILAASVLFAMLGLAQRRFLPHLALFVGFGAAFAVEPLLHTRRRASRVVPALGWVLAALALLPCLAILRREEDPAIAFDRARPVLDYLRTRTPATSHFDDPREPGEYGVLAEWSFGHFIQYYGQRPAVTDNFGDHAGNPLRPRDFFLAENEAPALALAESLRVRYVLVRDLGAGFEGLIPDDPIRARFVAGAMARGGGRATVQFATAIETTVLYRLAWRYGSAFPGSGGFVPPLAHFRLVGESQALESLTDGSKIPYVKLYEIVPGAKVTLPGLPPGDLGVWLSAVHSPNGQRFPFVVPIAADSTGTLSITVPYPTAGAPGESWIDDGEIRIGREGGRRLALPRITADDVQSGRSIAIGDSARPAVAP